MGTKLQLPYNSAEEVQAVLDAFGTTVDTATNATKKSDFLGLMAIGQRIRITGEGNRIEQFLGPEYGEGDDLNWLVLRNSYEVFVDTDVAGVDITMQNGSETNVGPLTVNLLTSVGWFSPLTLWKSDQSGVTLPFTEVRVFGQNGQMISKDLFGSTGPASDFVTYYLTNVFRSFSPSVPVPPRGSVQVGLSTKL